MERKTDKNKRSLHVVKADEQEGTRTRPLRSTCLPDAPGKNPAIFDFALERDGNKAEPHQVVLDVERLLDTDAYDSVMAAALDAAELRRLAPRDGDKAKRNHAGPYTLHELWLIEAAHTCQRS